MSEETTIFTGSPSLVTRFGALFIGFLVLVGAVIGAILAVGTWRLILAGLSVLALFYVLSVVGIVKATQYEVTTQRVRIRRGIVTKRTDELELYRANDTSLIEPLPMRMFGLGTIEIRTNDSSSPTVYLHAIHKARGLREDLRKAIEECRDRKRVRVTELEQPDHSEPQGG
jgi:uncharacterized membrane protein YdbT with pleckstrin-like domain